MQLREILESNEPMACVVQGGGMRGTYSIAALAGLARMGYTQRFGGIYGSSAGALNGAFFVAAQAEECVSIYVDHLSGNRFINPWRLRPVIDIDYLIDDVLRHQVPLKTNAVLESSTELFIFATDAEYGSIARFSNKTIGVDLMEALRATAALPILFGKEVRIENRNFTDGGLVAPLPIEEAIQDGWKNILVVLTIPLSYRSIQAPAHTRLLMKSLAMLSGHSRGVRELLGNKDHKLNKYLQLIADERNDLGINIWVVAPTEEERLASRLTNNRMLLNETVKLAKQDLQDALTKTRAIQ